MCGSQYYNEKFEQVGTIGYCINRAVSKIRYHLSEYATIIITDVFGQTNISVIIIYSQLAEYVKSA